MPKVAVYNMKGEEVDNVDLNEKIFCGQVNKSRLHQVVLMYQANKRSGTASTKTRSQVRGGGRKPWRQKGTGRARAGSIRSPLWRKGGVTFGPQPRDYSYRLPQKLRTLALASALRAKLKDDELIIVDLIKIDNPKTKIFVSLLSSLKIEGSCLFILDNLDANIRKSARNIPLLTMKLPEDFNTYDVLTHHKLVITRASIEKLVARIRSQAPAQKLKQGS